nr:hypothetical protein [Candidatus Sigynarchaeum springense]
MGDKQYKLFSAVGSTPQAFANSISWFLVAHERQYPVSDVYFIATNENKAHGIAGTSQNIKPAIDMVRKSLQIMAPHLVGKVRMHEQPAAIIPEEDIPEALVGVVQGVRSIVPDETGCIIDMTAGRKTMSAALALACHVLKHKFKKNVLLSYYWLIRWTKESLEKKAHELGIDDIASMVFDLDKLDEVVKGIK